MLEGVHDEDGETQSKDVGQETGVEVRPAVLLQAADRGKGLNWALLTYSEKSTSVAKGRKQGSALPDVEAKQQCDEDTWDDDVTQTQHGKITGFKSFLQ